jgi:hypothetical protein
MRIAGGPARAAVASFLGLTALLMAIVLAHKVGVLELTTTRRAIGVLVGLMALATGNLLPKLRPLSATRDSVAAITAAERTAGWILVLMGLTFVGLFALAPLDTARRLSAFVALGGLAIIQVDWLWVILRARLQAEPGGEPARWPSARRTIAAWLAVGLAYVLVTASLKYLFGDARWFADLGAWVLVASTVIYSALSVAASHGGHSPPPDGGER